MITIVEPKDYIDKLWGKQKIKENETYRIMKYVLKVKLGDRILMHNVVSGELVILEKDEAEMLEKRHLHYSSVLKSLITDHFIVPEDYDEYKQVLNLRDILWRLTELRLPKEVNHYVILPTTACNAKCWYCFERGISPATMTENTANEVVNFIASRSNGNAVDIWWFGGEPTLAEKQIDLICYGLKKKNIEYTAIMSSNGYLFDSEMAVKAKKLWHIRQITISVDGVEDAYNRIKAFANPSDNPYQRMLLNIGLLLDQGIAVAVRMNYDENTYQDFELLLQDIRQRYSGYKALMVYSHQINRKYTEKDKLRAEKWFNNKNIEMDDLACEAGLYRMRELLPSLSFKKCGAANGQYYVITPEGDLACCAEQLEKKQIKGNIREGVVNQDVVSSWNRFANRKECMDCVLLPYCIATLKNCVANKEVRCFSKERTLLQIEKTIQRTCKSVLNR